MSTFLLTTRNPRTNRLLIISDDDNPHEYATEAEADEAAAHIPVLQAWGHNVVEVP